MKKLLLFLMLFTVGLTARAQVVYLTLDQDGMERKTDDAGKIYYAITGKVHNMKALKLTPSNYSVVAYYSKGVNYKGSFKADITVTETDTTFTLTVPWDVPLNTQVRITCQPKNNGNNDLGISPYVFTTCGFQHSITVKGVKRDADTDEFTYTCEYRLKTQGGTSGYTEEAVNPSTLKDFYSYTFKPNKRTYSYSAYSYDVNLPNNIDYDNSVDGNYETLSDVRYDGTAQTFSFSTSAVAGNLKINKGEYDTDTIATKQFAAYYVNLSLKDDANGESKKVVHAEVTDAAGNKVSGGKINYAIGSNSAIYDYGDVSNVAFYENTLANYDNVASATNTSGVKVLTDSTGVHTFYYLTPDYYKSSTVGADGIVDIDCDMINWMNRKIGEDGSSVSDLRIYFWYTPADDYKDNTSLFYAYKTLNDAVDADKIDKYTAEPADGTKIEYTPDADDSNGGHYTVTLQFKKNGVAADLPKDEGGNYKLDGTLDDGTEYRYEFHYFFGREEPSDGYWVPISITDGTADADKTGQMTFNISNTKFDDGLVNTTFYLMPSVTVGGITTNESVMKYDLNAGYDEACTTGLNYTNYLGDGTNGTGSSKTYDDLTGLLSKDWTTTNGTMTTKSGKTWTNDIEDRKYYQVSGNTTLSQTIKAANLYPDRSTFSSSDTYTLQAIVRSEKGAKLTLHLTHGDATATKTVIGLGMDENAHSTVNAYGCVDTVYSILSDQELINMGIPEDDIPKGGWQKLEATVGSGEADGDLDISITSTDEFDLNDVVLLKDANTTGHYLTTVPALQGDKDGCYSGDETQKLLLNEYKKFSFFDRGPNVNRVVYMDRTSALFNAMYDPAGQAEFVPFNYLINKNDGTGYKMFRLFLKDGLPYYFPSSPIQGQHQIACDYISYDREFTPGKMSTIALPFAVPVKTIFDWCTTGGYKAIEGKKSIDVTKLEPNWGVLKEISANGDVYFGQTWSYAADGSIGGTFRTRTLGGDSKFEGPIMFIKTVKPGKPFMGLKGDDNSGGLVLFTSDEPYSGESSKAPFTNDDNGNNYADRMVHAYEMKYVALTDNDEQTGYGLQVNSDDGITAKNNNYLFGTYRPIADIAAMRNTESSDVYHFYYWSAKDGVFRKASEGDGHKAVKCPPFRAFLVAKESSSTSAKPSFGFKVVNMYDMGTTTGIKSVTDTAIRRTADNNVYSLTGVLVRRGASTDGLPAGLYIVNGKKVIVNHK